MSTRSVSARTYAGLSAPAAGAALAVALLSCVAVLAVGFGSNFHTDDWSFMLDRNGHGAAVFLEPHNEHLSLIPIVIYKVLFETVGVGHFEVFRLMFLAANLLAAWLLLVLLRRHVASEVAVLVWAPVVLMGAAWSAMVSPFQIGFTGSMVAGLGMLLALERRTLRGDLVATALLAASLACSGLGLPWVVIAGVEVLLGGRWLKRAWIVAIPVVLYGAWYVVYGGGQGIDPAGNPVLFAANAASAVLGAYVGLDVSFGRTLFVLALIVAGWRLVSLGRVPVRTVSALAGALTFWGLTGLVRDPGTFGESRYLLPGGMWLALAAAPLLPRTVPPRPVLLGWGVAVAIAVIAGSAYFVSGRRILVDGNRPTYARLQAVELARDVVARDFLPDAARISVIRAGPYLDAVDRYAGSPAMPLAEVRASDAGVRREFDEAMVGAHRLAFAPSSADPGGPAPTVEAGGARTAGSCVVGDGESLVLRLPAGVLLDVPDAGGAQVKLRRLGDDAADQPTLNAPAGARSELRIAPDALEDPWHARVDGPAGTRVCGLAG